MPMASAGRGVLPAKVISWRLACPQLRARAGSADSNQVPQPRIRGQDQRVLPPTSATSAAVRKPCHVRRVAEIDTVSGHETGHKPAKERAGARILNPDEKLVEMAGRLVIERPR